MKNIILLSLLVLICSSCEDFFSSTLEVDPPPHDDQMVMHSYLIEGDTTVSVNIATSQGLFGEEGQTNLISGAVVELFENDVLIQTIPEVDPNAQSNWPYNYKVTLDEAIKGAGNVYKILATHGSKGSISASQAMPEKPVITDATFEIDGTFAEGETVNSIEFVINDPVGQNYYEVALVQIGLNNIYSRYLQSIDVNTSMGVDYGKILVSDSNFDGDNYRLICYSWDDNANEDLGILVRALTRDQYLYAKSVRNFNDASDFGVFAEPVSVYTNIENGLGIFGASSSVLIPLN